MREEHAVALAVGFVEQLWSQHLFEALPCFVSEDYLGHGPVPIETHGIAALEYQLRLTSMVEAGIGITRNWIIEDVIAEGDRVVTRLVSTYEPEVQWAQYLPPADQAIPGLTLEAHPKTTVVIIHRIASSKIAEQWVYFDDPVANLSVDTSLPAS